MDTWNVIADINDRKQAETALQNGEEPAAPGTSHKPGTLISI